MTDDKCCRTCKYYCHENWIRVNKANIVQSGQNTVILVKNWKEENNEIQGWRQSKSQKRLERRL